jgi:hypothetical protein
LLRPISSKRRYRCSDCTWTGWRPRLRRHGGAAAGDQIFNLHERRTKEVWYLVVVAVVFVLFLGTVLKECSDAAPIPPTDTTRFEQPSARRP